MYLLAILRILLKTKTKCKTDRNMHNIAWHRKKRKMITKNDGMRWVACVWKEDEIHYLDHGIFLTIYRKIYRDWCTTWVRFELYTNTGSKVTVSYDFLIDKPQAFLGINHITSYDDCVFQIDTWVFLLSMIFASKMLNFVTIFPQCSQPCVVLQYMPRAFNSLNLSKR